FRSERHEYETGDEEEPTRAVEQEEAQMPPSVAPGVQVRGPAAAVRRQRRRHLADVVALQGRLDDHLAGELHAAGLQPEPHDRLLVEGAQPAVEVADLAAEEQP